ncbi:MAG: antibiotic biosynthesis monooxygenase [Woeseiaceae bacterium]|nr:antibiotic biosynthesis monooxygenase [Woeseiaceae bacterium]
MMTFLAKMTIKEGCEDEFVELAKKLTDAVHANEPETLAYEFYKLRDEERGYAVYEKFSSEEAEQAHQNTPHFLEIAPALIECIDGTYVRTYLDSLD